MTSLSGDAIVDVFANLHVGSPILSDCQILVFYGLMSHNLKFR